MSLRPSGRWSRLPQAEGLQRLLGSEHDSIGDAEPMMSREEIRVFYDRFGTRQFHNKRASMDELRTQLVAIEADLDAGSYRVGAWDELVRRIRRRPQQERRALAADVSRASRKLHARNGLRTVSLPTGIACEVLATAAGGVTLGIGRATGSSLAAVAAAVIWITTFQPLVKVLVGALLGVRYEYAYLRGIEPRFKMRYGTYLVAPRWARIVVHLSGTVGSPLAAWLVGKSIQARLVPVAGICMVLFWAIVALNALLFGLALIGLRRIGPIKFSTTSGEWPLSNCARC
jgi:hypothetical protein